MAIEERIIEFDTIYKTTSGSNGVSVFLQNAAEYANTINVFINNNTDNIFGNNKKILPGQLCILMKNHLKAVDFEINQNGELIVHTDDAENYSIDSDGNLIYTFR